MGKNRGSAAQPIARVQTEMTAVLHHGPLPTADEFRRYGDAMPGAAERIMGMAEREQAARLDAARLAQQHHCSLQRDALRASTVARILGQLLGAGVIGGTLWVARDLLMTDRSISGMSALLAALVALAGLFVYRHRRSTP